MNPLYGKFPSAPFFIFMIFVLTLSKGSEIHATLIPEIAEAVSLIVIVYLVSLVYFINTYFASLYDTKCEQFTAIALAIVGIAPVHSPFTPYSLAILPKASNTFL